MSAVLDITGQRIGMLVSIKRVPSARRGALWLFQCDCGKFSEQMAARVLWNSRRSPGRVSCGCARYIRKHNLSHKRVFWIWIGMRRRCYEKNNIGYKDYGGRGIRVCKAWRHDAKAFCEWALANGYADDLTIERINVNGNYTPNNCTWIPNSEQWKNKRKRRNRNMAPVRKNKGTAVERVADKFGGMAPFARLLGVAESTVRTWQCVYDGTIPSKHHKAIFALAKKHKKRVTAKDLVNV